MSKPETVICTFRVKPESLEAFLELHRRHWQTLSELGMVTATPEQAFRALAGEDDQPTIVSIFEWADATASDRAHEHPDIAEIWEAMDPLCESRNGRPAMEFPHFEPLV